MIKKVSHALITSILSGTRPKAEDKIMSTVSIIRVGRVAAGFVKQTPNRQGFVFHAADERFATLEGSSFANRHAAQRAADRVGATQNTTPSSKRALPLGGAAV